MPIHRHVRRMETPPMRMPHKHCEGLRHEPKPKGKGAGPRMGKGEGRAAAKEGSGGVMGRLSLSRGRECG